MWSLKTFVYLTERQWDIDTVTASDYTVSYRISKKEYTQFRALTTDHTQPLIYTYMKNLKERFEPKIEAAPAVFDPNADISIAHISFAFNNDDVYTILEKRGTAYIKHDYDQMGQIEEKYDKLKEDQRNELTRPVIAYITFLHQEGYERAKKYKENDKNVFSPAKEPTNIIWENTHNTDRTIFLRTMVVNALSVVLLILTFAAIFYLNRFLVTTNLKYMDLNCKAFDEKITDESTRLKYAMIDHYNFDKKKTGTKMTGALICFCQSYSEKNGVFETISHKFSHPDVVVDGAPYEDAICSQWGDEALLQPYFANAVSFIIVFLNYYLRVFIMAMIKRIGQRTQSRETNMIMVYVFVAQFFNTGISILLINANTNEAGLKLGIFNGSNPDFDYSWYDNIGSALVSTMLFNAYWPFIELGMEFMTTGINYILDKG